ncbi:MAG: ABC transporter substrate-binding protein [Bacillota bacterium]
MMKKTSAFSKLPLTAAIIISFFLIFTPLLSAEEDVKISVSSSPSSLPIYYMQENSDLNIKSLVHKNRDIVLSRLMKGDVDLALLSTNEAAKLYNKGIEIQLAGVHTWGYFYIATLNPEIKSWDDLKGKEIYVPDKGGPMDIIFHYLAEKTGLDVKNDITIKRGKLREVAQLMINDMAETSVLREPFLSQLLYSSSKARIAADIQKLWEKHTSHKFPQSSLVVRKEFAETNPEFMAELSREYKNAVSWVNNNKTASGRLLERYLDFPAEITELGHERLNLNYIDAEDAEKSLKNYFSILAGKNPDSVGGRVPDEKFYYKGK